MCPLPDSTGPGSPGPSTTAAAQPSGERERLSPVPREGVQIFSVLSPPLHRSPKAPGYPGPGLAAGSPSWPQAWRACHPHAGVPSQGSARAGPPAWV